MKKHLLWLALSLMMSHILKAQTIDLVRDINVTGTGTGVTILETAASGNILFFLGNDGIHGTQLWKSDGTAAGTFMLTDIFNDPEVPPTSLRAANGLAFYNVLYNNQIWLFRSDGTKEGTFPLKTTSIAFGENNILAINNSIYFSVISSSGSHQLWKTDGTVAGTVLVKEISNNILGATGAFDFFNFNGTLYFLSGVRYSGQENFQLWKSDGTAGGTVPGPAFGDRFRPVAFNGYMYFSENNVLKRTDGAIITAIKTFTFLDDPIVVGTNIYFSAQDGTTGAELWKSNGTAAGTVLVKDINPGTNISSFPAYLSNANGTLYFSAVTAANNGRELWKSNGTAAGTVLVTDVFSGGDGNVREVTVVGNQVVFTGNNSSGPKLWKSDGTSGGTQVIANFYSTQLVNAGGTVFFSGTETIVTRLYKTNLTPASTIAVSPLTGPGSQPQKMFDLNGTGYFTADNGINGRELWKTDNTNAGTVLVKDILPGSGSSNPDQLTNVNGTLFFVANAQEIWKSNGTSAGTVLVKDVVSVSSDRITGLIALNGTLFFGIATSSQTLQLWKSDGTSAGTVLITTFPNTGNLAAIAFNGQIYFLAWDGVNSYDLWKSNGTAAGTTLVKDVASSGGASGPPVILNNYLYYVLGNYESSGQVLVRSDGTSAGTTVITNLFPGDSGLTISGLFKAGNLLYFNVLGTSAGRELLWRTDGTAAGTIQLGDFDLHYTEDPFIRQKTEAGGKFFFVPYDDEIGDQLWVSDGTPSGTNIVKQIGQFANDFTIDHTAAIGDVIYFTPYDAATGTELWRSDGTSDGTYMVYDLTPNGSTRFYDLADVNGTLLISASAGPLGAELYKYQPAPAALRINSGGASFAASGSRTFIADQYFSGTTQISNAAGGDIVNTTDDQLYKDQRFGTNFNYSIPVTNGPMNVVLHFAEIYWGVPSRGGSAGSGKRRFHVDIEGSRKLTNYDIFTAAGGAMRARTEIFTVNITDGTLNISFLSGASDKPIIAAIEIVPTPAVIIGPLADAYVRNTPNDNTNYGTETSLEIKTGSLPSYQRNTYLKFPLAGVDNVGSAKLRLYGSNIQGNTNIGLSAYGITNDAWTETGINWSNAPTASGSSLGSVNVNGTAKYYEIDVTAFVQSQLAGDKTASFFVTNPGNQNTQLTFNSRENGANRPQLVIRNVAPPAARIGAEDDMISIETDQDASGIYPNPVNGKHFSVNVSNRHKGEVDLSLVNKTGQLLLLRKKPEGTASTVEVDVSATRLPAGLYLLKIESKAHKEVLKLLMVE